MYPSRKGNSFTLIALCLPPGGENQFYRVLSKVPFLAPRGWPMISALAKNGSAFRTPMKTSPKAEWATMLK